MILDYVNGGFSESQLLSNLRSRGRLYPLTDIIYAGSNTWFLQPNGMPWRQNLVAAAPAASVSSDLRLSRTSKKKTSRFFNVTELDIPVGCLQQALGPASLVTNRDFKRFGHELENHLECVFHRSFSNSHFFELSQIRSRCSIFWVRPKLPGSPDHQRPPRPRSEVFPHPERAPGSPAAWSEAFRLRFRLVAIDGVFGVSDGCEQGCEFGFGGASGLQCSLSKLLRPGGNIKHIPTPPVVPPQRVLRLDPPLTHPSPTFSEGTTGGQGNIPVLGSAKLMRRICRCLVPWCHSAGPWSDPSPLCFIAGLNRGTPQPLSTRYSSN